MAESSPVSMPGTGLRREGGTEGEKWEGRYEGPSGSLSVPRGQRAQGGSLWGLSWQMKPPGVHSCQQDTHATEAKLSLQEAGPATWDSDLSRG